MTKNIQHLILLAKQNDLEALNEVGYLYFTGEGVRQDYQKALSYYQRAADLGHAVAHYNLALMYDKGFGVAVDGKKALYHYQLAADKNILQAQYNLGVLYQQGVIVEKNLAKALYWYQRAAQNNQPNAQHNLAYMYFFGQGVEKDEEKAVTWFLKAADRVVASMRYLGLCYQHGCGVRQDFVQAFNWYHKAASLSDAESAYALGNFYLQGIAVKKDLKKAAEVFAIAVQLGSAAAHKALTDLAEIEPDAKAILKNRVTKES